MLLYRFMSELVLALPVGVCSFSRAACAAARDVGDAAAAPAAPSGDVAVGLAEVVAAEVGVTRPLSVELMEMS